MDLALIERTVERLLHARHAIVLTGAGISTESGVPDFRSPGGIWERYDPSIFFYERFLAEPAEVWAAIIEMHNSHDFALWDAYPNRGHQALAHLEELGHIKTIITQNVDNLHQKSGSRNVIEFHGNMLYAKCLRCARRYTHDEVLARIDDPSTCACGGLVKPDVIFFGEAIPPDALLKATYEARICDLMLVIGTSAQVEPAASLPHLAKGRNPLAFGLKGTGITKEACHVIEINREPTPMTGHISDFLIQGSAGEILSEISSRVDVKTKAP